MKINLFLSKWNSAIEQVFRILPKDSLIEGLVRAVRFLYLKHGGHLIVWLVMVSSTFSLKQQFPMFVWNIPNGVKDWQHLLLRISEAATSESPKGLMVMIIPKHSKDRGRCWYLQVILISRGVDAALSILGPEGDGRPLFPFK